MPLQIRESVSERVDEVNSKRTLRMRREFSLRNPSGIGLLMLGCMLLIAAIAPYIANEKPIFYILKGQNHFPPAGESRKEINWKILEYDRVIWAPVTYSPGRSDRCNHFLNAGCKGPSDIQWFADRKGCTVKMPGKHRHWLGTGPRGEDVLAGLIHGARTSLLVGIGSMALSLFIGILLGSIAGYFGDPLDTTVLKVIEWMVSVPQLILLVTAVATIREVEVWHVVSILGLTSWMHVARLTRSEFLRIREERFVESALALGYSHLRIIFRHILPNALAPVLVTASFGVSSAIMAESALSFLGIGLPPEVVSWGAMLRDGMKHPQAWWLVLYPGLMIFATVTAFNLIGEGLRRVFHPAG